MLEQLKSPSQFAMEVVIHIIATVATVAGCTNPALSAWAFFSCIFNLLGTAVTILGGILAGLDRLRQHDMSFVQLGGMGITTSLFITNLSLNETMGDDASMVSSLYEEVFKEPWAMENSNVDSVKLNQGLKLVQSALSGPLYKNNEGYTCLALDLYSFSDLDVFVGWKQEVCFNDVARGHWNPWDVSNQPVGEGADRGSEFSQWLKRYGVDAVSLPWIKFFGKGTFHALSSLWDETKLIMKGGNTVDDSWYTWNVTDSGNTLVTVGLWKDLSGII